MFIFCAGERRGIPRYFYWTWVNDVNLFWKWTGDYMQDPYLKYQWGFFYRNLELLPQGRICLFKRTWDLTYYHSETKPVQNQLHLQTHFGFYTPTLVTWRYNCLWLLPVTSTAQAPPQARAQTGKSDIEWIQSNTWKKKFKMKDYAKFFFVALLISV